MMVSAMPRESVKTELVLLLERKAEAARRSPSRSETVSRELPIDLHNTCFLSSYPVQKISRETTQMCTGTCTLERKICPPPPCQAEGENIKYRDKLKKR
jgi:hypothetical protein